MPLLSWIFFGLALFLPYGVRGILTPSGTVDVDCGGQQIFTCNVTGITATSQVGWVIMRLVNITASGSNGVITATMNPRITGTGGNVPTSTITIADFTMSDNGGTVQCINTENGSDQGTATISVELPSCPTSFSTNRNVDFTNATVTYQLESPPPVTSTTVTYCPTSSPNCGNSVNCPSTGPCTISGLDPCVEYNLTAIPTNNCGSATGCTGNSMVVDSQELPSCPTNFSANRDGHFTSATVTYQLANTPPVTSTTVTYCPTSSPNCGNNVNCTSTGPCTIGGLDPCVEYNLTAIPTNNCGNATGCTGNSMVVDSQDVPPQLMNVDVQEIKDTSVQVTWNELSSTVTSVTVTYCPESTPDCRVNVNCTTSPCTINGLMPNTTYGFSVTPNNNCGPGNASSKNVTTNSTGSGTSEPSKLDIVVIVVPIVAAIILVALIVIIVIMVVIWRTKKKHGVKDNSSARMSKLCSNEERANLSEDTYASPGTGKPQPENTDGVYSYAATETKIGAQMKEREQQKKQPPPQGDFYEEPNAAKNVQHKAGTITGETYAQPDKPKRGTKKKDKQQKEPVPHKEAPAGELYAMPDKKKDVSHTSGPVTGDEYAVASKPKTGGGYGAHGPQ